MNVVMFGRFAHSNELPLAIARLIPSNGPRYYVGSDSSPLPGFLSIRARQLSDLDPDSTLAIVFDPIYAPLARSFFTKRWIAFLSANRADLDLIARRCWDFAAANASLVMTASERVYLEQTFRRDNVFLFYGESNEPIDLMTRDGKTLFLREFERLFRDLLKRWLSGEDIAALMKQQWRQRFNHYDDLNKTLRENETASFLLSIYSYLLALPEAEADLLRSFELASLKGQPNLLTNHYRFRSAIQARQGDLERAIWTYGVTAFKQIEKQMVETLVADLRRGVKELANARLLMLNDDYREAVRMLRSLAEAPAGKLLFECYVQIGRADLARSMDLNDKDFQSCAEQARFDESLGWFKAMEGKIHEAIHYFLKAASFDDEAINHILLLREFIERIPMNWKGGRSIVSSTDTKKEEQPIDGDVAGEK